MSELTFINFRSKAEVFAPVDAPRYAHFFSFFIYLLERFDVFYSGLITATVSRK